MDNPEVEYMGESPLEKDTRFQPGVSGNPAGRPKGSKTGPRSKMRSQLMKLCELQPDAIEILRISMTGKNSEGVPTSMPSKEKVDMAKFVVNKIESLNNTCLREEALILGVRDKGNAEGAQQLADNQKEADATSGGVFSLDMETPTQH